MAHIFYLKSSIHTLYSATMSKGKGNKYQQYKARAARGRALLQRLKDVPCADCNTRHPFWVMQFDHCRGTKSFHLNKKPHVAMTTLLAEVAKCDVVCANCHADRTYKRTFHVEQET
jgi:hypothetical protein